MSTPAFALQVVSVLAAVAIFALIGTLDTKNRDHEEPGCLAAGEPGPYPLAAPRTPLVPSTRVEAAQQAESGLDALAR